MRFPLALSFFLSSEAFPGSVSLAKGETYSTPCGSSAKLIPLANPEAPDDKEREKQEREEKPGEGPPRGGHRCHSNHNLSSVAISSDHRIAMCGEPV